jgi:hypothetical protein
MQNKNEQSELKQIQVDTIKLIAETLKLQAVFLKSQTESSKLIRAWEWHPFLSMITAFCSGALLAKLLM